MFKDNFANSTISTIIKKPYKYLSPNTVKTKKKKFVKTMSQRLISCKDALIL